ncbi:amidohydrolase [Siccirubricoccus sp. KC 17139]|uniref:Amidohydrolase n=1 Tax=Siccirubricoccus soli TaxID=2899147 RepID=A0ABT1D571_9PROT|nr:amidohydrolase [Siccirubricoccus soli]MCO6417058.1 amidohydrolase [Siccirubricoccus soli]MCP2683193.1 amidohydrolase [Siccirubricoccus soli]
MTAELLIEGRVFRGLAGGFAEALAIRDGRVLAVGSLEEVVHLAGPGTQRLALGERVAIPAFNEAHMHLLPYGIGLAQVNLRPEEVTTLDAALSRIKAAAAKAPKGAWILGRGYDHAALDVGRHPTAAELDAAAPNNPVWITRTCGHMGVANSAALAAAGIGHNTPDPEGGVIERRGGALTGLIQERAMRLVKGAMPVASEAVMIEAIELACGKLASYGFASATDMYVGAVAGLAEIPAYRKAQAEGRLPLRMWQVLGGNPEDIAQAAWEQGLRPMQGDDGLRWGAVKVFADGSAGGLTAAFFDPYLPAPTRGVFTFPDETMHALLKRYHEQGWQLDIHAIGDAAIEQVLQAMEAADTPEHPFGGRRHRIEHCGFVTRDQRRRMRARGILPVPQPVFMYEFGDLYVTNLGPERSAHAYPMKTWLEEGHHPAASSDCPVSTVDPFVNLFTMVTRRTNRGTVLGPEERLSVAEAIHCQTWCGAYTQFAEDRRGALEPGMLADLAVLSRDVLAGAPEEILGTRADLTLRDGRPIFDRHGELTALDLAPMEPAIHAPRATAG